MVGAGVLALALAGCGDTKMSDIKAPNPELPDPPSFAYLPKPGLLFDRAPPGVTVVRDGPNGELLNGPAPPLVPESAVDVAVAEPLRSLLSAPERRRLAEASQRAAAEYTLQPVAWEAIDDSDHKTAVGTAVAVDNAYRAVRSGRLCRNLRQAAIKGGAAHQEQVTLCRQDYGNGLYVWITGLADE
jgi:surface antigen